MANNRLTWNDVTSQVDNYSDAGRLGVLTAMGLGQAFANAGKSFSDMYSEAAAQDALQYLAQAYDPNNMQSINQAMPLALASNPGMSSEMLKYLTGAGRTLMNTQLDVDNLNLEKERARAAQNAIDVAVANADTKATRAANEAMKALNVRADARTYGDVDTLLTSQAQRAKIAADIAATRALQQEKLLKRKEEGASYSIGKTLVSLLPETLDMTNAADREVAFSAASGLAKELANIYGLTEADAYNAALKGLDLMQKMRAAGAVPTGDVGLAGTLTGSFLDDYGREDTFSWKYDINHLVPSMPQQVAAQVAMGQRLPATAVPNRAATRAQAREQEQATRAAQTINSVMSMGRASTDLPYQTANLRNLAETYSQSTGAALPTAEQASAAVLAQEEARNARLAAADKIEQNRTVSSPLMAILTGSMTSSIGGYSTGFAEANDRNLQLVKQVRQGKALTSEQVKKLDPAEQQAVKAAQEQTTMNAAQQSQSATLMSGFALRDSFGSNDITPQGQAERDRLAFDFKKNYDQANRDVNAALDQALSTDIDTANSPKTADATRAAFDWMQGLTSNGLPTDILNLKNKDGKALTKEEVLSLDEDGYFDAFINGKDWSNTEKGTARQYYTDLVELYKKKLGDSTLAYLLSIANLSDFNEHNSGITRFLGDEEDFQGDEEIMQLAYKTIDVLTNPASEMYQTLLRQAEFSKIMQKAEESRKAREAINTSLYNMQIQNKLTNRSTPLDVALVNRRLQDRTAAGQQGYNSIDSILRGISQPY